MAYVTSLMVLRILPAGVSLADLLAPFTLGTGAAALYLSYRQTRPKRVQNYTVKLST